MKDLYNIGKVKVESVDKKGRTAAWLACQTGHTEAAKYLIKLNARFDHKDNSGRTPFEADYFDGMTRAVPEKAKNTTGFII